MASSAGKQAGQQFGNYRLLHLQAQDDFADAYLGEHVFLRTLATIKVIRAALAGEELENFLAGVRSIARLKHPHIVRVLEFGVQGDIPFLVTNYAPRGSLRQIHPEGSSLPATSILDYVGQIAAALHYIHSEHLAHGNLRPENILLGQQNQILLSDFGTIALDQGAVATSTLAASGQNTNGALDYRAPEQLLGKPCPASDQYALAVIVYEWLKGRHPLRGPAGDIIGQPPSIPAQPLPESTPEVASAEQVVLKALARDPELRFATVSDFAHTLEQALQPPAKPTQQLPDLHRQPDRKRPTRMISALIVLLVLLAGSSGLLAYKEFFSSGSSAQGEAATATAIAQNQLATANATFSGLSSQDIYARVTGGRPIINDALNNQAGEAWQDEHAASGACTFAAGAYRVSAIAGQHMHCLSDAGNLSNLAFQVEMTIEKGDFGGVCFRSNSRDTQSYFFGLHAADGSYLSSIDRNSPSLLVNGDSPFIKPGLKQTNLITVIVVGSHFYFYVNEHYIKDVIDQDNTLSSGRIGLTAGSSTSPPTEVIFRNAKVWKL